MNTLETVFITLFLILMATPGVYGLHLYALMVLAWRRHTAVQRRQREVVVNYWRSRTAEAAPAVTTQIPLYNEQAVAERIIEAVAAFDYPRHRHQIQVLDDSTDATREIVDACVARLQADGYDIEVVRRPERTAFKAGALAHGLTSATGTYIAIFDADFEPRPDFLRQMIPLIDSDERIGCVQGRWGHLNRDENWITAAISIGIDGHFGVEQGGRAWNGLLLNFNGTGGIWRKATIDDPAVGGWSGDTITEDLDLSYRAQLANWKIEYCLDVECPAEIPADVDALKTQQRRWATGSIQTARKILPRVWAARLPIVQKLEATIHLTQYSVAVYMLLMIVIGRWLLMAVPEERYRPYLESSWFVVLIAAAAPSIAYWYARWTIARRRIGLFGLLKLICLGLGLSVNNSLAVVAGLFQRGGTFVRTPKSGSKGRDRRQSQYDAIRSRVWLAELALSGLCLFQWLWFLRADRYVGGTFLLLFAIGLFMLGWGSRPRRSGTPQAAPVGSGSPQEEPPTTREMRHDGEIADLANATEQHEEIIA